MKRLLIAALLWLAPVAAHADGIGLRLTIPDVAMLGNNKPLFLDTLGAAASSFFAPVRVRGAYTGPWATIERASDSTTKLIGFDGNIADVATAAKFCASTTCSFARYNDQSGNGNDFVEATAANQPTLVLSCQNGLPCARGNGTSSCMVASGGASLASPETLLLAARSVAHPATYGNFVEYSTMQVAQQSSAIGDTAGNWWFGGSNVDATVYDSTVNWNLAAHTFIKVLNGTTLAFYIDTGGTATGGGTVTAYSGGNTHMGLLAQAECGSNFIQGDIFWFGTFQSALSSAQIAAAYAASKATWNTP